MKCGNLDENFMTHLSRKGTPFSKEYNSIVVLFKYSSLKDHLPMFNECVNIFLENLRPLADGKKEVSMKLALYNLTLDVISKVWLRYSFEGYTEYKILICGRQLDVLCGSSVSSHSSKLGM